MSESPLPSFQCPTCGEILPKKSSGGCPVCLMKIAMSDTLPTLPMATPHRAPTIDELAPLFPQLDLLEFIGRGGMGLVYKARQKSLDRLVALKLLAPAQEHEKAFKERFATEARALAALDHPNIVTVYDSGETSGFCYLLMEYMDGVNLRQAMRADRITPEQALAIVPPICEALQYAHERGIVHRDIKPENLLMNQEGKVKIADFGIAKMVSRPDSEVSASDGETSPPHITFAGGTPQYMAPEQKRSSKGTDHRVDIYSLGVVLYELLTGELPQSNLQAPSQKVQIDVRLDQVVLRALERSPELRFQTAGEMRTQLATVMQPESPHATPPPAQRKPLLALMTPWRLMGLLAIAMIGLWVVLHVAVSRPASRHARLPSVQQKGSPLQTQSSPSLPSQPAPPQTLRTTFVQEGAQNLTGSYLPMTLRLSPQRPATVTQVPEGVSMPAFGQFSFGPSENRVNVTVMVGSLPNLEYHLWVDGNVNGDLTDDPLPDWQVLPSNTPSVPNGYSGRGGALVHLPYGSDASAARVEFYAPPRAASAQATQIFYHSDYFRTAKLTIDGKPATLVVKDSDADGDFRTKPQFAISTGERSKRATRLKVFDDPLTVQLGERLYEIRNLTAAGDSFEWVESTRKAPLSLETEPTAGATATTATAAKFPLGQAAATSNPEEPLVFAVGKNAPPFAATTISGDRVQMPQSFKGKVLLLDFWATWCGPCVAQMPHLATLYKQYQNRGLEILGVSLDTPGTMEKLPAFLKTKNITWPQICEGDDRKGLLTQMYRIHAVPTTLLIDGDTGAILSLNARGEALEEAVREAVAVKRVKPAL